MAVLCGKRFFVGGVAQGLEQSAHNRLVPCSSQGMPKLIFPLEKGLKKSIVDMYKFADVTQLARVTAFQAVGCAFESRHPLHTLLYHLEWC